MKEDIYSRFECKRCTDCCFGEGGIKVSYREAKIIASYLKISLSNFLKKYCKKSGREFPYSIKTGSSGYCIFWENGCSIHPVKPDICRKWPLLDRVISDPDCWQEMRKTCRGLEPYPSFEDFLTGRKEEKKG